MTDQPTPYQATAHTYRAAGWAGVLPLPARAKKPVPEGYTGTTGVDPSAADIQSWIDNGVLLPRPGGATGGPGLYRQAGNIALRLPDGIIGIDVDNYGLKQGDTTLAQLTAACGPLPSTWRTTSRDDGVSGIYLYRVPTGLAWPGIAGPGIEIIQRRHRYAVVWPSVHPDTGREYRWIGTPPPPADATYPVPQPREFPELPDAWIQHLTQGALAGDHARADLDLPAAAQWLAQREGGQPCRAMTAVLAEQHAHLATGASRHDAAAQATAALCHLAGEGHTGAKPALAQYRAAFAAALHNDAPGRLDDINGEWRRMLTGAVQLAAAAHPHTPDVDPCDDPFAGLIDTVVVTRAQWSADDQRTVVEYQHANPPRGYVEPVAGSSRGPDTAAQPGSPWAVSGPTSATIGTSPAQVAPEAPGIHSEGEAAQVGAGPLPPTQQPAPTDQDIVRGQLLRQETERARARRGANRLLDDEEAAATFRQPAYTRDLIDELALPDEDTVWRVEHVMPADANITLAAPFKAGKTTLVNHLTAALVDGIPFLDTHKVHRHPTGRVAIWNLEVGRGMYRRWIREAGIEHPDRVTILPLRGYRMPLQTRRVEDWAVDWLQEHNVTTWILDPFAAAYKGLSENDNAEVGRFLDAIDVIKQRAGVSELIMPVHTGRGVADEGQERARGATRLDDWADVRWILTRDEKDGETTRYFRAIGRDVDVPEARLGYDEETRRPYVTGPSRYAERRDAYDFDVLQAVGRNPGISTRGIRAFVREARGTASNIATDKALARLIELSRIRVEYEPDGRQQACHYLDDGLSKLLTSDTKPDVSMSQNDRAAPDLFTVPETVP